MFFYLLWNNLVTSLSIQLYQTTRELTLLDNNIKVNISKIYHIYRVTYKGWDRKDDLKLSKYDDYQVELNTYKETNRRNFVRSSLKSHPFG